MSFISKLSNGWRLSMTSLEVLKENPRLLVFPIISGASLLLIFGSFITAVLAGNGWDVDMMIYSGDLEVYGLTFLFYLFNYFVVVFFNMALMHCTRLYFSGEEPTIGKGIRFSMSRIRVILAWAVFAATVGLILRIIQDNLGWLGKIITGILGFVWSLATFFVVPILAYEELGPIDAVKRSSGIMKQKWGEGLTAGFSFGLLQLSAIILLVLTCLAIGLVLPATGVILFALGFVLILAASSALHSIFIAAVYNNISGGMNIHFDQSQFDGLFEAKEIEKKRW